MIRIEGSYCGFDERNQAYTSGLDLEPQTPLSRIAQVFSSGSRLWRSLADFRNETGAFAVRSTASLTVFDTRLWNLDRSWPWHLDNYKLTVVTGTVAFMFHCQEKQAMKHETCCLSMVLKGISGYLDPGWELHLHNLQYFGTRNITPVAACCATWWWWLEWPEVVELI